MSKKESNLGITVKKEKNFSEWYLQVVRKGGFKDQRTHLKGFDAFMPWGYATWEKFVEHSDKMFKKLGVKNTYFPMLIPLSLFEKEKKHFKGFDPQLIKIEEIGGEKLEDPVVLRTTSETIIYHMFSQWIRSWRDLPFKVNQWANILRWETKMTKPLIRTREFLWQEGHTAHVDKEDAVKFVDQIKDVYLKLHNDILSLPCLILKRTESDKFAGAEFSIAFDLCMPDGKIVQGATDHLLSKTFPRAFNVNYEDKDGKTKHVRTTSWGISEREIGMTLMIHGDNKGAILPPNVSPLQVIIIPIIFKGKERNVMKKTKELERKLGKKGILLEIDDRDEYTAGFKFNEWELKGVPLRIEIGPKDVAKKQVVLVRRDTGKRSVIKEKDLNKIPKILEDIQKNLFNKADKFLKDHITNAKNLENVKKILKKKGGFIRTNWCGSEECENNIKDKTNGAEIRGILYNQKEKVFGSCVYCRKKAKEVVYIAKAY